MRMTPLDIQNHRFSSRWRGYDSSDVDAFMNMVAEDYESLVREVESLRDTARRQEARIESLSANENNLRETLVTATAMAEDLKNTAIKEAELIVGEAEVRAEKVLDAAHRRAAKLSQDLREMKELRSRLAGSLRSTIETHLTLIESLAGPESDRPEEDNVAYLTPHRKAAEGGGDA